MGVEQFEAELQALITEREAMKAANIHASAKRQELPYRYGDFMDLAEKMREVGRLVGKELGHEVHSIPS